MAEIIQIHKCTVYTFESRFSKPDLACWTSVIAVVNRPFKDVFNPLYLLWKLQQFNAIFVIRALFQH